MISENTITAIIVSFPATLGALGALIVSVINGIRGGRVEKKTDTVIEKTAEIHVLTNSQLQKVTAALENANTKITGLEKLIVQMQLAIVTPEAKPAAPIAITGEVTLK